MAINWKKIFNGFRIVPKAPGDTGTSNADSLGDLEVLNTTNKIQFHNGTSASPLVTEAHASQGSHRLQNKDLEASTTAIVDATDTTKKVQFDASSNTTGAVQTIKSQATTARTWSIPDATDTAVGTSATQTLTNKTIAAGSNTISGLTNSNLSGSAGITGANIATNTVANSNLSQMAANTIKGNNTAGSANASDLTASQVNTLLGTVTTVGTIDSGSSANGLTISGNSISTQTASGSQPGQVSTTTQTFAGDKTFSGNTLIANNAVSKATIGGTSSTATHQVNGGMQFTTKTVSTATYSVDTTTNDYILDVDTTTNAPTITLPTPTAGRTIIVKDYKGSAATHNITINPHSTEKIDGASSLALTLNYTSTALYSDGTNWFTFGGGSGGGTVAIGTIDTQTASTDGLVAVGSTIYAQSASNTKPGLVNTTTQTLAGQKTFSGGIITPTIGDNGNDITIQNLTSNKNINLSVATGGEVQVNTLSLPEATISAGTIPTAASASHDKFLFGNDHQPYAIDSSGNLRQLSTKGPVNYIDQIKNATSGWSTYGNTAKNIPTTGTGGSPTGLAVAVNATSPLRGIYDFKITKSVSLNSQGSGVSYDFTIDSADQARVLAVNFDYNASSGFATADGITAPLNDGTTSTNSGNSDLEVFIYDKTNSQLIYVTPQVITAKGSNNFQFKGTFQTASNSTSYRLIFHVATTSNTAWTFNYSNVFVGPQSVSYGPPVSDWKNDLTFTFGGVSGSTSVDVRYKRIGDSMHVRGSYNVGTVSATNFSVILPSGFSIDSSKLTTTTNAQIVGTSLRTLNAASYATSNVGPYPVFYDGSDTTQVYIATSSSTSQLSKSGANAVVANGEDFTFEFSVPIAGWSSTTQMSNDTDTRVVSAAYYVSNGASPSVSTTQSLNYDAKIYDTHNAVTASAPGTGTWKFTAPISGYYRVTLTHNGPAGYTLIYKNGSLAVTMGYYAGTGIAFGTGELLLNSGDYIDIRDSASASAPGTGYPSQTASMITITRISGPSAIAASESVNMNAYSLSSTTITGSTAIVLTSKQFDSHGAYNTSTGVYTCPISGKYRVSLNTYTTTSATIQFILNKNGSGVNGGSINGSVGVATSSSVAGGSMTVQCSAGDTLTIVPSASGTMSSSGANLSIERIGN